MQVLQQRLEEAGVEGELGETCLRAGHAGGEGREGGHGWGAGGGPG